MNPHEALEFVKKNKNIDNGLEVHGFARHLATLVHSCGSAYGNLHLNAPPRRTGVLYSPTE